ncbi:MAG: hypothetical protein KTR14_08065 [Vampirovibrio sp.]|nr:hypothetical protein [Vampirovibrio sp.]
MSSFKKSKSKPVPVPKAPDPPNFFNFEGDFLRSATEFDKGNNAFNTRSFNTPGESQRNEQLSQLFSNSLNQLRQTPEQRTQQLEGFQDTVFNQLSRSLEDEFQRASRQSQENFNARGFLDSTGFEDFRTNNLDKLKQEGLTDAAERALLAREQLAAQDQNRLLQLLSAASGGLQNDLANQLGFADFSRIGQAGGGQQLNANFQNQLNATQAINNLRAQQAFQNRQAFQNFLQAGQTAARLGTGFFL